MRRSTWLGSEWAVGGSAVALALSLVGCDAVLGLGSLKDEPDGGGATIDSGALETGTGDATSPNDGGVDATLGNEDSGAEDTGTTDATQSDAGTDAAAQCAIGSDTYASGAVNPANPCESCQPAVSASGWSSANEAASCGTAAVCHAGACGAGCGIGGVYVAANATNASDPCEVCSPTTATGTWSDVADGTSCDGGTFCKTGACASGCEIQGTFYANGAPNPNNSCQTCQVDKNPTDWSNQPDATNCGNGQFCSGGQCGTECNVGGTIYKPGDADPTNPCRTCQPGTTTSAFTNIANGSTCGTGDVCDDSANCISGCFIGGTVYAAGLNPNNACQTCSPGMTNWSTVSAGTGCGTNEYCSGTTCLSGCLIGGQVFAAGPNPSNACETCVPGASSWTTVSEGSSCGTGEVCDTTTCESGCFIGGSVYTSGTKNPTNVCQLCQPGISGWAPQPDGTPCGTGGICYAGQCGSGCEIGSVHYSAGDKSPTNSCQTCQPGTSTTAFTNVPDGTNCGGTNECSDGACDPTCTITGVTYFQDDADPSTTCSICWPAVSTTAWSTCQAAGWKYCSHEQGNPAVWFCTNL